MTITRKTWVAASACFAGAAAMVAAVIVGGLYALDRVDAAADRQAEATRQAAADQVAMQVAVQDTLARQMARHAADLEQAVADVEQAVDDVEAALYAIDSNRIGNVNKAIEEANERAASAREIGRGHCGGGIYNSAIVQNGCYLKRIIDILPFTVPR